MKHKPSLSMFICLPVLFMVSLLMAGERPRPLSIIYPGEGIGNIRFGYKLENVIKALGWKEPEDIRKDEQKKKVFFIYKKRGIIFVFKSIEGKEKKKLRQAILTNIVVTSPAFVVAQSGIRVGDKKIDIDNYMKRPPFVQQKLPLSRGIAECAEKDAKGNMLHITCHREGIKFVVNKKSNIIEAIEIFPPS